MNQNLKLETRENIRPEEFSDSSGLFLFFGDRFTDKQALLCELQQFPQLSEMKELEQVHSNKVIIFADEADLTEYDMNADAMVTNIPGIALTIRTADCYPILFYDNENRVIGAAHSGREGTRKNITSQVIRSMKKLGADLKNIHVAIGPGISGENYQVDKQTWQEFCDSTNVEQKYRYLDIRKEINRQLLNEDIKKTHIHHKQICTFSDNNFYSYRREQTKSRQYSFIILLA